VTRWQRHALDVTRIPGGDQVAARIGVVLQAVNELRDLVDFASLRSLPVTPLLAIDGTEITVPVGPFIPDADAVLLQVADVGVALQEPQQLVDDRSQVQLLGGQQGKTGTKVETHLPAEYRARADAGAVCLGGTPFEDVPHQVEILLHAVCLSICQSAL
jgi:hypothetical protein